MLGWIAIAAIYGFLGASFRPSRSLVLGGGVVVSILVFALRMLYFRVQKRSWPFRENAYRRYAIVGQKGQANKIHRLLKTNQQKLQYRGYVDQGSSADLEEPQYLGGIEHLDRIVRFHQLDEIIFCSSTVPSSEIMQWMTRLGSQLRYKIAPDQSLSIIGSSSKNSAGELYTFEIQYNLANPYQRRNKRLFDLLFAILIFLASPILVFLCKDKHRFWHNLSRVFSGQKTWVSYASEDANDFFPRLKPGVLSPAIILYREDEIQALRDSDYYYARDYSVWKDLSLVLNNLKNLGKT